MPFERRFVHYSPGPSDNPSVISNRAIAGAWFELHRQGGCGSGELHLRDDFPNRSSIQAGDWIAFEFTSGQRWYFGRVEERRATSPAGVRLRLEGMAEQLTEVLPGGFGSHIADQVAPHRYGQTDLFVNDPDHFDETFDRVETPHQLMRLLMQQYVVPNTDITLDGNLIEPSSGPAEIVSVKFRGEETVVESIKDLALRARNASWGVDENGTFFFLRKRGEVMATFREGTDTIRLDETVERNTLFNRVELTGGYIYGAAGSSGAARFLYRWRGNYIQPASRTTHGERRIKLWVPWIRSVSDSREFAREFFRIYAQPTTRYQVEVGNQTTLPKPWGGRIRLENRDGSELFSGEVETIRVEFDHSIRFRFEIGAPDPKTVWPAPRHDERTVIPGSADPNFGGERITFTQPEIPNLFCGITGLFHTGEDAIPSSPCDVDNRWKVDGGTGFILSLASLAPPNSDTSKWISVNCSGTSTASFHTYSLPFTVPTSLDPSTLVVTCRTFSDDQVIALRLNGNSLPFNPGGVFAGWVQQTLNSHFVVGQNMVEFDVDDRFGSGHAFRCEWLSCSTP